MRSHVLYIKKRCHNVQKGAWPAAEQSFVVFDYLFTIGFLAELIARLGTFGIKYLCSAANALDALIVVSSVLDTFVLSRILPT